MGAFVNRWGVWPFCKLWSCEGTQKYSKAPHLTSNETFTLMSRPLEVELYFTGIWALSDSGKLGQNTQIMFRNTWKVIHCLQFHISQQLRTDFYVKFIWGLSYTCFMSIIAILGKLGPKSWVGTHKKGSKILFTLLIKLSLTLFSRLTYVLVLWVFVHWGNFDKVDRNTPKSFVGAWKIIQSFYSSTFHMRWGYKQTSWLSESQNHFCLLFLGSSSHLGHLIRQLHFTTLNSIIYCNLFKFLKTE